MKFKRHTWFPTGLVPGSLAAICLLALAGGARAEAAKPMYIVAFGDSTTAPRAVEGRELAVYADLLATDARLSERGVKIINAGVSANTTSDARARFRRDVLARRPAVVIIQFGINDAAVDVWKNPPATAPRVSRDDYAANLSFFVTEVKRRGAQPILMTPNPLRWTDRMRSMYGKPPYLPDDADGFNVLLKSYADAVREVAKQTGTPLVDVYAAFHAQGDNASHSVDELLLDGMHPNEKGHRLIVDLLKRQLAAMRIEAPSPPPKPRMKPAAGGMEIDARATELPDLKMGPFVRLGDGRLLTVEGTNSLTSADKGKTWKTNPLFADSAKYEVRPERALIRTSQGVVILAFMNDREKHWTWQDKLGDAPGAVLPTYAMRSTDEGRTWEAPQKLHDDWSGCVRNILETKSGQVVFTAMMMLHHPGRHAVLTYCSDDQGKTWKASNVIDLGGAGHHGGVSEATAVELKNGRLIKYIRTNWERFWLAESKDGGLTWHPLGPTDVPASSAPGLLQRLASGRIILIWNRLFPEGKDAFPKSGGDRLWSATPVSNHRGELSIAFSDDECKSWTEPVVIARKPGGWLSYPYLFEAEAGELWLTTMQGGVRLKFRETDFVD
ncbi:MAG: exo-alpha-sialidase [Verrucomicrobiae bacterium]|nr:exo-alpha-sialidase [Verrucomicrobiae bacterium]